MARIVVCSLGFRGHVNPLLPIVEALASRGHDVAHYCTEEYAEAIRRAGAQFHPYRSLFEAGFSFPKDDATFSYFLATVLEARKVLPQVLEAARDQEPDLVLYDGACLSGRLLGEILGCPTAKLCPSYASTETYSPFEEGRRAFFASSEMVGAFEAERGKLNAEFDVDYTLESSGGHAEERNIVCMPRQFHWNEAAFDERFVFIGPSLPEAAVSGPPPPPSERPRLYISLGTLNNDKPDFYQRCFEAFGSSGWDVVMPTGDRVESAGWEIPENFRVRPSFPQLEVLRATRCFVSQGGMNSVQESLFFGVPLVVLPSTSEQSLTARRVEELGLGADLGTEAPSVEELQEAVQEVAEDEALRQRVREFSLLSRSAGGPTKAADALEAQARGSRRPGS